MNGKYQNPSVRPEHRRRTPTEFSAKSILGPDRTILGTASLLGLELLIILAEKFFDLLAMVQ